MKNGLAFLLLWAALTIQATLFQIPPINVIQPDLVLVVMVVVALTRGPRAALLLGILVGLCQDIVYGAFIGLNAFTYAVIGYFAGSVFAQFLHRNVAITFLVTISFTFVNVWITYGLERLFDVTEYGWQVVMRHSFAQMIIDGVVLLILYPFLIRLLVDRKRRRYPEPEGDGSAG
ncbi:MAG: rod shape-determining protein MreD [Alicyclobacillus herbarius]|uniref:rod shape-determining protein MreD n=1 Tax=Alicyclobacillus herbarius TaxID=122960 RepID=UPI00041ED776|nr:rod shape-determining protein MreD [Alicyclobacillus herbarius]MCL6631618.1 rod shape-determining protein MreD [Alicyclobacillus herbarius]